MKKIEFYTMKSAKPRPIAVKVKGYTDGTYNVYFDRPLWRVIEPSCGLQICDSLTQGKAITRAHELTSKVDDIKSREYYKKMVADFERAVAEAKMKEGNTDD